MITLGGGRRLSTDGIDYAVGFEFPKKIGDRVEVDDPLMIMHYNETDKADEAEKMVQAAYNI